MQRSCPVAISLLVALILSGCAGRIGSNVDQDAARYGAQNTGPTSIRMIDKSRGTLTADGSGSGTYTSLSDDAGLEKVSTGSTPREVYYDERSGRFMLSSGTDINAENVEITRPDGVTIKLGKFGTVASEPQRAANEAYDRLTAYWEARDEATKERDIAAIKSIEATAPELAGLILKMLGVP